MNLSMQHMKEYFNQLTEYTSLSQADQETLYTSAILELLILKVKIYE